MSSDHTSDADLVPNDSNRRASRRRRIIWGSCLLTTIAIVVLLGFAVRSARRQGREIEVSSRYSGLLLALHNYHEENGHLPPAYVADENGKPMHSWRVLILPYIQNNVYKSYDFDEPWDGPNNSKLVNKMPWISSIASSFNANGEAPTHYTDFVLITGQGTAFPGSETTKFGEISDKMSNTILMTEIADSKIPWLEPRDIIVDEEDLRIDDPNKLSISAPHGYTPRVGFADGQSGEIHDHIPSDILKSLTTIAGGEPVNRKELVRQGYLVW